MHLVGFAVISFLTSPMCQTESNAFSMSKNTAVACSLFKNPVVMLSMMCSNCSVVECSLLYANCVSGMAFCVCLKSG